MQTEVFYDKSFQPNGRIAVEAGYNPEPGVREKRTVIVLPPRKKRNNVVCHRGVSTVLTRTISVLSSSMVASGFIDSIEDTVEVSPWRDLNYLASLRVPHMHTLLTAVWYTAFLFAQSRVAPKYPATES